MQISSESYETTSGCISTTAHLADLANPLHTYPEVHVYWDDLIFDLPPEMQYAPDQDEMAYINSPGYLQLGTGLTASQETFLGFVDDIGGMIERLGQGMDHDEVASQDQQIMGESTARDVSGFELDEQFCRRG
jgi:hypothetical protein